MDAEDFDVIIVGGSYAGLASGMALGRALRKVLIIDSGKPCNRYTPHSHNFITHDGRVPAEIAAIARQQVGQYRTVTFFSGLAVSAEKKEDRFYVATEEGKTFTANKLVFATGIRDLMPDIPGFEQCWGKSVLHCPYCHGHEVRNEPTAILGNGAYAFEFAALISNWTNDLSVCTNGQSTLTKEQTEHLSRRGIRIIEYPVGKFENEEGYLHHVVFGNGESSELKVVYTRPPFVQHSPLPESLGCELTDDGYIKIDTSHMTTIAGIYACGDNVSRLRTVANAVAMGTTTGMMVNKELTASDFLR